MRVFKIGGSSLKNQDDYENIARKLCEQVPSYGNPIVVVISAGYGETERLWEEAEESFTGKVWQIEYVALEGEFASAHKLQREIEKLGKEAKFVSPWDIDLRVKGDNGGLENCELIGADQELFDKHVTNEADADLVIIPGYVGIHDEVKGTGNKPALAALGRNSTDLIGVEVAKCIQAPLYFVKSAPSVYAVSPNLIDDPEEITDMTYEQALRFLEYLPQEDQFVMRKAVEHAWEKRVELIFGSLDGGSETKISASPNGKGGSNFAALPVKENAAVISFTTSSGNRHRAKLLRRLQDQGVNFSDINQIEDFEIRRVHYELYTDDNTKNALSKTVESFASDKNVETKDVALITLIDTSLDPESHHSSMVADAFSDTDIEYTVRTSGVIMHIPVRRKDIREAVKLLAKKFGLTKNAD